MIDIFLRKIDLLSNIQRFLDSRLLSDVLNRQTTRNNKAQPLKRSEVRMEKLRVKGVFYIIKVIK